MLIISLYIVTFWHNNKLHAKQYAGVNMQEVLNKITERFDIETINITSIIKQ